MMMWTRRKQHDFSTSSTNIKHTTCCRNSVKWSGSLRLYCYHNLFLKLLTITITTTTVLFGSCSSSNYGTSGLAFQFHDHGLSPSLIRRQQRHITIGSGTTASSPAAVSSSFSFGTFQAFTTDEVVATTRRKRRRTNNERLTLGLQASGVSAQEGRDNDDNCDLILDNSDSVCLPQIQSSTKDNRSTTTTTTFGRSGGTVQRKDILRQGMAAAAIVATSSFGPSVVLASNSDQELIEALKPIFGSSDSTMDGEGGSGDGMQSSSASNIFDDTSADNLNRNIPPTIELLPPGANPFEVTPVKVPRVGYSFYKTDPKTTPKALELALEAGVRHFDMATQYGSNVDIGNVFLSTLSDLNLERNQIFLSHKVSNEEQSSTSKKKVKDSVKQAMKDLNAGVYFDCVYLHSPLTDKERRFTSYKALVELQQAGQVRLVGVCHFGVKALEELVVEGGLPPPSIIQLAISPFNQHKDVVQWAKEHGCAICCSAWSKLSSVQGPQEGWSKVAELAKMYGVTKAQILVKWALQKGYLCVPRSGIGSKVERLAIQENSYNGVRDFTLTKSNMELLDSLDEQLPLGRLGVLDGYDETDIVDDKWDPTQVV